MKFSKTVVPSRITGSLPLRERGLKFGVPAVVMVGIHVAPLAGAWIEICSGAPPDPDKAVAPLAGAWIEISLLWCRAP